MASLQALGPAPGRAGPTDPAGSNGRRGKAGCRRSVGSQVLNSPGQDAERIVEDEVISA